MKILIYQQQLLGKIPAQDLETIRQLQPEYLCLPEYFFNPEVIGFKETIAYLKSLSQSLNCLVIGGTTITTENDCLYNSCFLALKGEIVGEYRKVHLYHREEGKITPGNDFPVFKLKNRRIGILICVDVLFADAWNTLAAGEVDLVFVPTFSPYRDEKKEDKFKRDEDIFVSGARLTQALVIKVCGIGTYKDNKLQGRSLAATSAGILWRVNPDEEDQVQIKLLNYSKNK